MPDRPHIILIMTDQQRADTLGAYGDRQCQTPHLDELAEESVVFERHYTPSPLCVPARTALATGLYPHRNGAIINHWIEQEQRYGTLGRQHVTVYERLLEAGYQLGHVGVQHIRSEPPLEQRCGAATFIGSSQYGAYLAAAGLSPPKLREYRAPCPEFVDGKMICHWYSAPQAGRHPLGLEHFYDVYLARQAVELIGRAERARPLALMCMFFSPHPPLAVPEPYDRLYEPDRLELPAN
ncbi:MAG: sulfatase-like hydrolase/transferase, partial [Phycisphaerae bacterium]